ncbi:ROK family protein [Palleronia sp. LCG004]|uniref:ROK family protein n=1 Tax=Palleronia sp. LCG004 TaxID=3079304 RepID=UPI002941F011|nr:ROK family protein [Palleronia sp. LCG004]WOI57624.1 ROK family protein [Palleronia sp. LCG004]
MTLAIGIDIGGTGVKYGLVDERGRILARQYDPLEATMPGAVLSEMIRIRAEAMIAGAQGDILGVGLVMPGHVDPRTLRVIQGAENLPALSDVPIAADLGTALGLPVEVGNDALAATLGEARFGAGRAFRSFAMLTLGTGIGGGLMVDGRLVHGPGGQPPEFGAIVLDLGGAMNPHGQPGTLETIAGRAGFEAAFAREGVDGHDLKACFEAARGGDDRAVRAVSSVARHIAQAIGMIVNATCIRACVIGGGIGGAGPVLFDAIAKALPVSIWPALAQEFRILPAERGNDAGLLGAVVPILDRGRAVSSDAGQFPNRDETGEPPA